MRASEQRGGEQGFALIGLMVTIFIILLVLGVAAPRVAKELRRDREVEAMQRGNQYVRAVQLYYRKFGHYPGSIEQLEKTNNIRFLRQKYVDPMTGKSDWRLIHVGEAKTTVKGFFGQPLTGVAPGLGSAAGLASTGGIGTGAAGSPAAGNSGFGGSAFGGTSGAGGFGSGSPGFGSSPAGVPGAGAGVAGTGAGAGASGTGTGAGGSSMGSSTGGTGSGIGTALAGAFVGVGSSATGESILELNEQTSYETWEFIYDPRIEQLKAAANLFGNGNSSGLGSASGNASQGLGGAGSPGAPGASPSGFGSSPSGFGSSPGGFGSTSPAGPTAPATGVGTKP